MSRSRRESITPPQPWNPTTGEGFPSRPNRPGPAHATGIVERRIARVVRPGLLAGGLVLTLSAVPCFPGQALPPTAGRPGSGAAPPAAVTRGIEYDIRASLIILGDLGRVGTLRVEEGLSQADGRMAKTLRLSGGTKPEQAAKGRDYGGEFLIMRPLEPTGLSGRDGGDGRPGAASASGLAYQGLLRKNGTVVAERVIFHPDHVVATREDGSERTIAGAYDSPLSALEHFLEAGIGAGDVHESHFIMDGRPYIFRCEVGRPVRVKPFPDPAFPIAVTTYDGLETDARGNPRVKKKGGIRVWLCKEGRYRDTVLRIHVRHTWYLTLKFDLVRVEGERG